MASIHQKAQGGPRTGVVTRVVRDKNGKPVGDEPAWKSAPRRITQQDYDKIREVANKEPPMPEKPQKIPPHIHRRIASSMSHASAFLLGLALHSYFDGGADSYETIGTMISSMGLLFGSLAVRHFAK